MTGAAARRALAHARWETRLLLRNGEQLLLTIVIPVGVLLVLTRTTMVARTDDGSSVPAALATALGVSVIGAAFTSLAIATAFERRSGALRFLGTTPLTRTELLVGKFLATAIVTVVSACVAVAVGVLLGWRPGPGSAWALPVLVLGTATFAAWGLAVAGALRAEAVLAVANAVFLILIMFGGVVIPAASLPGPLAALVPWLPSGALMDGLSRALVMGAAPTAGSVLVLAGWLAVGAATSARVFRWS